MQGFNIDKSKTLNAALYILNQVQEADYHKIFKILYFADQDHLKKFGRPITGDCYQAMNFGPVPSFLYDIFKAAEKGNHPFHEAVEMSVLFSIRRDGNIPYVTAKIESDLDQLSETDLEALNQSIESNQALNFYELVEKSHDSAWTNASKRIDIEMPYLEIAEAAGTSEDMIHYILLNAENDQNIC